MIKNIEFQHVRDDFQDQLQEDIKKINNSMKAFIPADKTANYYEIDKAMHNKLLADDITTYKKANDNTIININNEAKNIAANLNIDDRTECMAKRQAFITLKDHKDNFQNNPTCRLINPAKSEIGRISKQILENINTTIRQKTGLNQWKNSSSVINWFSNIQHKDHHTFAVFDIENFYPSITEKLLTDSINFAKQYIDISDRDIGIIMHSRKYFYLTATPHGSRKTTAHSTSPWAAMTERKCANWLACSFSTDCPANTGKKVSDFTGTTGSQFLRTSQDHKQNESGKTSLDTSRTTDSRLLYRPT